MKEHILYFDQILEELIEYDFEIDPNFKVPHIDILTEGFTSKSVSLTTDDKISVIFCRFGTGDDDVLCMLGNLCPERFPYDACTMIDGLHLYTDKTIEMLFKKYGVLS